MSLESKNKKTTLDIEGMTCANCALGVEKQLVKLGADNVNVNFAMGEAIFDAKGIDVTKFTEGITNIGYPTKIRLAGESDKLGMSSVEKKFWFTLIFTLPLLSHMFLPHDSFMQNPILQGILALPVFIVGVLHFGRSGFNSLKTGVPNMDVLIFIGSFSAFTYSTWGAIQFYGTPLAHNYLFFETAASIVTLVLLGNVFEDRSVKKTTSAIKDLSSMQVKTAKRFNSKGEPEEVKYIDINVGDLLLVNTGDKIPVDGVVMDGDAHADESMISGESMPVHKAKDDKVIGSTILNDGNIIMKAQAVGEQTVLSKIIELVKNAQHSKPDIQRLGDKVSGIFVPIVIGISLLTFLVSQFAFDATFQQSMLQAIAVLVISCPCAMGLATPTAVMVGIGRAAKKGILIKGGSTLEEMAKVKTVIFDKTGTLTTGNFTIQAINVIKEDESLVKNIIFTLENRSSHPIAKSIIAHLIKNAQTAELSNFIETKGIGISGVDQNGDTWQIGSYKIAKDLTSEKHHEVYLTKNQELVATIDIEDEIKTEAALTISALNEKGIETILLSGDKQSKCDVLAKKLNIRTVYAEKLPEEKLAIVANYTEVNPTIMVGDGVNDAPALAKATVGISFGNSTDVSMNTAQVVLLGSNGLDKLSETIHISQLTLKTIKQNLFWAFFYNVMAIPVAAFGFLSPIIASGTMAFSDVIVIGNSIWLKVKK